MYFGKFCEKLICLLYLTIQGNFAPPPRPTYIKFPPGIGLRRREFCCTKVSVASEVFDHYMSNKNLLDKVSNSLLAQKDASMINQRPDRFILKQKASRSLKVPYIFYKCIQLELTLIKHNNHTIYVFSQNFGTKEM